MALPAVAIFCTIEEVRVDVVELASRDPNILLSIEQLYVNSKRHVLSSGVNPLNGGLPSSRSANDSAIARDTIMFPIPF